MNRCLVISDADFRDGPYGIDKLGSLGYVIDGVKTAQSQLHRKLRDAIEHRSGIFVDAGLRSIPKAFSADVVLAFLEAFAVTPA